MEIHETIRKLKDAYRRLYCQRKKRKRGGKSARGKKELRARRPHREWGDNYK